MSEEEITMVKPGAKALKRQSGVELLRILAAMAVVVLHFNYFTVDGGVADYATGFGRTL